MYFYCTVAEGTGDRTCFFKNQLSSCSPLRRQWKHAPHNSVFSLDARVRAGLAIAAVTAAVFLDRAAEEQRSTVYSAAAELSMNYAITYKIWYEYVRAPAPSTAVKNIIGYSTRNHKFKHLGPHFQIQRRGRDGRSRKLLSLCHTHGSAPRSPYMPCQIMDQWKSSELEQNYGVSDRKN